MAVNFSPIFNSQVVDENGDPAVGWKIYSYVAGSSTPLATYTDSGGGTAQSNPIVINALGFPTTGQIWLTAGSTYKLTLTDENDVVQKTEDNISGLNDFVTTGSEWIDSGLTPTYISATSFSVPTDQTTLLTVGRRLKTTNTGGTIYSTISASVFSSVTTVTVVNDSGTLDSGISAVSYGIVNGQNSSIPVRPDSIPLASDLTDPTKRARLDVGSITTATVRVITMPDSDVTLPILNLNATQNANIILGGPASGSAAVPTFRSLVAADMPRLTTIVSATSLPVANNVDIDDIPQTFSYLLLVITGAATGTATRFTMVQVSTNNGSSYDTTAGNYPGINVNDSTAAANDVASLVRPTAIGAAATATFTMMLSGYQAGPLPFATCAGNDGTGDFSTMTTYIGSTSAIDSLRILLNNTGNFSAGTYALYGMA